MRTLSHTWLIWILFVLGQNSANAQVQTDSMGEYLAQYESLYVCMGDARRVGDNQTLYVSSSAVKAIINKGGYLGPCAIYGDKRSMGNGHLQTYVQLKPDGKPWAIGFRFPETTLQGLPSQQYDGANCFDINGNGQLDFGSGTTGGMNGDECIGGHERVLSFPALQKITPFKWGLVNWQAHGHIPPHIYDTPHFDFHFYTQDFVERNFIRVGPCGMVVNCDDMSKAQKPIPASYSPPGYAGVGAVEARMGDHLIDMSAPEMHGVPFTETWIYGAYDGKLTFWEPMITNAYLETKPYMCKELKLPARYHESGYYPTSYCIRYRRERQEFTVSLEGFEYRTGP